MSSIYQSDPHPRPDAEFVPAQLSHLVAGNVGRLLDARRTPIAITAVHPDRGAFELEIRAFEDAGARWELSLEEVARFQFPRGARTASPSEVARLERARARFHRPLRIAAETEAGRATAERIASLRAGVRTLLETGGLEATDLDSAISRRQGEPGLFELLEEFLRGLGLAEQDEAFAAAFVSNPASGERVKGHAIVLAELGLCSFEGWAVRDPHLFSGAWSRDHRARHLMARLAFSQELWAHLGLEAVTLYRGTAAEGPLHLPEPRSFVSATFSAEVAQAHFEGGPRSTRGVLWRQEVPVRRLLMTFLETRSMNRQFSEAEAVLIGPPGGGAF